MCSATAFGEYAGTRTTSRPSRCAASRSTLLNPAQRSATWRTPTAASAVSTGSSSTSFTNTHTASAPLGERHRRQPQPVLELDDLVGSATRWRGGTPPIRTASSSTSRLASSQRARREHGLTRRRGTLPRWRPSSSKRSQYNMWPQSTVATVSCGSSCSCRSERTASDTKSACPATTSSAGRRSVIGGTGRHSSPHPVTTAGTWKRRRKRPSSPSTRCSARSSATAAWVPGKSPTERATVASSTDTQPGSAMAANASALRGHRRARWRDRASPRGGPGRGGWRGGGERSRRRTSGRSRRPVRHRLRRGGRCRLVEGLDQIGHVLLDRPRPVVRRAAVTA